MGYVFLGFAIVCNAAANVMLKLAAGRPVSLTGGVGNVVAGNAYLLVGLALFAVNVLLYVLALRALPLSVAYPLMVGMTFLIVSAAASYFLGEGFTLWHAVGYLLILCGIVAVSVLGTA